MKDNKYRKQTDYDLCIEISKRLKEAGLLTEDEFSKYQELIYKQYSPFISSLFKNDLKTGKTNANMVVHERKLNKG